MRKHELDIMSLVFGLFFVGAAAIWGLTSDAGHGLRGWPLPVLLIAVGVIGLLSSLASRWTRGDGDADAGTGPPQPDPAADPAAPGGTS